MRHDNIIKLQGSQCIQYVMGTGDRRWGMGVPRRAGDKPLVMQIKTQDKHESVDGKGPTRWF